MSAVRLKSLAIVIAEAPALERPPPFRVSPALPRAWSWPTRKVPVVMVVPPEKVLSPDSTKAPAPLSVMAVAPPMIAEIVAVPAGVAEIAVVDSTPVEPAMVPPEIVTDVGVELNVVRSNVPPEIVRTPGAALVAPRARVPLLTVVPPV